MNRLGDECDDDVDNDGIINEKDNCVKISNSDQLDTDGDTIGDRCDNCPKDENKNQKDINQNLIGDICEQGKYLRNIFHNIYFMLQEMTLMETDLLVMETTVLINTMLIN